MCNHGCAEHIYSEYYPGVVNDLVGDSAMFEIASIRSEALDFNSSKNECAKRDHIEK